MPAARNTMSANMRRCMHWFPNAVAWPDALPLLQRLRRLPAEGADRRRGERNALEAPNAVHPACALDRTGRRHDTVGSGRLPCGDEQRE